MRVKHKTTGIIATASDVNRSTIHEFIVQFDDGDADSAYFSEWEPVDGTWAEFIKAADA